MGAIEKLENKMVKKTNFLLFSFIAALIASPAYSVTVSKTYVDSSDKKLQSNILLLRDMLNTKDSSGNWVTLDTEEQLAIPAINELNAEMATKQDAISADNLLPAEYVSGLAAVATSGSYNDLTDVPVIPSMDDLATSAELTALQTALETSIAEKQDKGEYLVASDLTTLNEAITALQNGKADASTVTTIQETISKLGDTYATKADMTAADAALQSAIDNMDLSTYAKTADLAKVATSGQYSDLEGLPEIPSIEGLATSAELTALQTALETSIAEKQEKGEYLVAADLTELNNAITALQSGKADASTVTTIQETISKLGDTYATKADMTAADEALQSAIDNMDLSAYAKIADVEATYATKESVASKADVSALTEYAKTADVESALGAKEDAANKLTTATADEIEAMSSDDKATKFPSVAVAQTIANAAVTKVNEVAGDLSTLQTQVGTNTADIAEIKAAGYQTADDVSGAIETATADLATKSEVEAVSTVANAAAVKADVDAALENIYTKTEVDAAIEAIEEYDDTALAARVTANEGAIATNTTGIADNKSAIESLQNAGFVAGTKTAGSYLVNFDAEGNASYAAVEILDATGAPIDLTTGAVK